MTEYAFEFGFLSPRFLCCGKDDSLLMSSFFSIQLMLKEDKRFTM